MSASDSAIWLGAAGAVMALFAILSCRRHWTHRRLQELRGEASIARFAKQARWNCKDFTVIEVVFRRLQALVAPKEFPVFPNDDLEEIYGLGHFGQATLQELVEDICKDLGIPPPSEDLKARAFQGPIRNVQDLIEFIEYVYERPSI